MPKRLKLTLMFLYELVISALLITQTGIVRSHEDVAEFGLPTHVDANSIVLALALFLPLGLPYINKLKAFGMELELELQLHREMSATRKQISEANFARERESYQLISMLLSAIPTYTTTRDQLIIGKMDFVESELIAEIMRQWLGRNGVDAVVDDGARSTVLSYLALRCGRVDLLAVYSGTSLRLAQQPDRVELDPQAECARLAEAFGEWGLARLEPLGFQNREYLVLERSVAARLGIRSLEDLRLESSRLRFGLPHEFMVRPWGFPGLLRDGLVIDEVVEVGLDDRLSGLYGGAFDVGYGWSTDPDMRPRGRLIRFPIGPSQHAIPMCREGDAARLGAALEGLRIDEDTIRRLLVEMTLGRKKASEVAEEFMASKGR